MRKTLLWVVGGIVAVGFVVLAYLLATNSALKSGSGRTVIGYEEGQGWTVNAYGAEPLSDRAGPFIRRDSIYTVRRSASGALALVAVPLGKNSIEVVPLSDDANPFVVGRELLARLAEPPAVRPGSVAHLREKTFVLSDVEGDLARAQALLTAHGVIDGQSDWTFDSNTVVFLGDMLDRGPDGLAVLWLIAKLQAQAQLAGGEVLLVLGNHEAMNLQGDWRYAPAPLRGFAQAIQRRVSEEEGGSVEAAYGDFWNGASLLGAWLSKQMMLAQRGDFLFVHGGLHPAIVELGLDLEGINIAARRHLRTVSAHDQISPELKFLFGESGPLWYRGMVRAAGEDGDLSTAQINRVLAGFDASRVVVGHTVVEEVSQDYSGRVIRVDVVPESAVTNQGLLIEGGQPYRVDATGGLTALR